MPARWCLQSCTSVESSNIKFCPEAKWAYKTVQEFEQEFLKKVGGKYCVAVNSGYSALFLAIKALKITGEVLVPEFTMIASANAVKEAGATPVFVDVDDNGNIDVSQIEDSITHKTEAIMPCHIYGLSADSVELRRIAKRHDLAIISDAAEAHGCKISGTRCYSFYANKHISTGEGGAVVTDRKGVAEEIAKLRSHYFGDGYTHEQIGYGFRMNPYGAVHGLKMLKDWDSRLQKRKRIAEFYDNNIRHGSKPQKRDFYWMYGLLVREKDELRKFLLSRGVETRDFFAPMSMQPPYLGPYGATNAYRLWRHGVLLPTMPELTKKELKHITDSVNLFYER